MIVAADDALDLMAMVEEAGMGKNANMPRPIANRNTEPWVEADVAGIPQRQAPPQPWTPRVPEPEPAHANASVTVETGR